MDVPTEPQPDRKTWFASPERTDPAALEAQHAKLREHPLLVAALDAFPGPAALLDGNRQIVLTNDQFDRLAGKPLGTVIGSRPGEALDCVHSHDHEAGCGTGPSCVYCGAVQTIVQSQQDNGTADGACQLLRQNGEDEQALEVAVRCAPLEEGEGEFTVLALQDVSGDKRRELLERIFFHDALNVAGGVTSLTELLVMADADEAEVMRTEIHHLANRLVEELEAQRDLVAAEKGELRPHPSEFAPLELLEELHNTWTSQQRFEGVEIVVEEVASAAIVQDRSVLRRVLENLIKNALEASTKGQLVRVGYEPEFRAFFVRNEAVMPDEVQRRLFHRTFSTKAGNGHGIGLWSVQLLTTRTLGGEIEWESREGLGTEFRVVLPEPAARAD